MSWITTQSKSRISKNAKIQNAANISIGAKCTICAGARLNADKLSLGSYVYISEDVEISRTVKIGSFVTIGPKVHIEQCTIGSHVQIGDGCHIGAGSRIGDNVIVKCDVDPGVIVPAGSLYQSTKDVANEYEIELVELPESACDVLETRARKLYAGVRLDEFNDTISAFYS